MTLSEEFLRTIDADAQEALDLLIQLGKIPAPSHHEEKRVEFISNWLKQQGAEGVYVDKALNCIHTEYAHALSVQEIADRLNLDRCYFSSLFSKQVGVAPGEYLRTLRLNKAAELMTVYDEKPSTAALSVGYEDLFHFSKSFKKQFGVSPREYVRQAKQNL